MVAGLGRIAARLLQILHGYIINPTLIMTVINGEKICQGDDTTIFFC